MKNVKYVWNCRSFVVICKIGEKKRKLCFVLFFFKPNCILTRLFQKIFYEFILQKKKKNQPMFHILKVLFSLIVLIICFVLSLKNKSQFFCLRLKAAHFFSQCRNSHVYPVKLCCQISITVTYLT